MADNVDLAVEDYLNEIKSTSGAVDKIGSALVPTSDGTVGSSVDSYLEELRRPPIGDIQIAQKTPTIDKNIVPIPQRKALRMDEVGVNLQRAAMSDATEAARKDKLAKRLGVPVGALPENAVEQAFFLDNDPQAIVDNNPAVARFLNREGGAELAGKNVDKLRNLDSTFRRLVVDPLLSLGKTTVAIPQAALGLSDITNAIVMPWVNLLLPAEQRQRVQDALAGSVPEPLADALFKQSPHKGLKAAQDALADLYSPEQQAVNRDVQQAQGFVDTLATALASPSFVAHTTLQSLGPMFLGAAGARALVQQQAGKVSATVASAIGEGAVMSGSLAEKIVEEQARGLTPGQVTAAVGTGVVGGAIGYLGSRVLQKLGLDDVDVMLARGSLEQAAKTSGMPTGVISRVLLGAAGEGLQEMPQSAVETIAENVATGKAWDEGVPESMAIGLVSGAAMGGPIQAISKPVTGLPSGELPPGTPDAMVNAMVRAMGAAHADATRSVLTELSEQIVNNPLRQEAPDAFRDFVRDMVEEGDESNLTEFYVKPEILDEVLSQSGLTQQEIEERIPAIASDLSLARATGGEVRVPVEDYATYLAGTPGDSILLDNARTTPEGMTYLESQEYYAQQEQELTQQAVELLERNQPVLSRKDFEDTQADAEQPQTYESYLKAHTNKAEAFATDVKDIQDRIVEGLTRTGRFTKAINAMYAVPFREFYAVNAAREGILPSELYARLPLNFQQMSIPGSLEQVTDQFETATAEDFFPENVKDILKKKDWMILTASNPGAQVVSDAENAAANDRLRQDLVNRGLKFDEVFGRYQGDDKEAPSFLVYDVPENLALEMARTYGQDSVLTRDGLIYRNGSKNPSISVAVFDSVQDGWAAGGYTRIPSTNTVFSVNMDFNGKSYVGRHYTHVPRSFLSGWYSGRGLPGVDNERLKHATDRRIRKYLDFYTDVGNGIIPEAGLGNVKYDLELHNIYDGSTNPDGFKLGSGNGDDLNAFESQILDAGYNGYFTLQGAPGKEQGRIRLLGDASLHVDTGEENAGGREERILPRSLRENIFTRESDGSLQGLPRKIGNYEPSHWPQAEDVAKRYMDKAGLTYKRPDLYVRVDRKRAERIAKAFGWLRHRPNAPEVKASYDAMVSETVEQYRAILESGLQVEFIEGVDPYAGNPREMIEDVRNNNHMWVYSTRDGFGSGDFDPSGSPLLAETEFEISGKKALVNDLFRVVHDYFGHVKEGVGFRADGEENAWRAHVSMYSPLAARAMTTETRGQNSWVNFGPHGEHNRKASAEDTIYADQKIDLLPEWVSQEGAADEDFMLFQFAGKQAQNANLLSLENAIARIERGDHEELIRQETGWFQGPDGKWRFEINDAGAFMTLDPDITKGTDQLLNIIQHDRLFAAYPNLQGVSVSFDLAVKRGKPRGGSYNPNTNTIEVQAANRTEALSTLLHEIQHAIQSVEGFAVGGNTAYIAANPRKFLSPEQLDYARTLPNYRSSATKQEKDDFLDSFARVQLGSAYDAYFRLAGEVEARNVQIRANLSDLERQLTAPRFTSDVPVSDLIVVFDGVEAANAPQPNNVNMLENGMFGQSEFYSALERSIEGLVSIANKQGIAKTDQVKSWIESRQKEGRFKKEEVEAIGLMDWLNLQGDSVAVVDVAAFVRENGVKIREVNLSSERRGDPFAFDFIEQDARQEPNGTVRMYGYMNADGDLLEAGEVLALEDEEGIETGVYQTTDLHGRKKEFSDIGDAEDELRIKAEVAYEKSLDTMPKFGHWTLPGGEDYRELALTLPGKEIFRVPGIHGMSDEADINRLAHIRFNDRTSTDGERVLFLEELQSDWAQEGRTGGFRAELTAEEQELQELNRVSSTRDLTDTEAARAVELQELGVGESLHNKLAGGVSKAPFVEETKDWVALTVKRMLRYAAENNYDAIAWTTGKQQTDRYNLAKHVQAVEAVKSGIKPGLWELHLTLIGGQPDLQLVEDFALASTVGGDLAAKIRADQGGRYAGLDLQIGGSGMVAFYDGIVPQVVNSILKKLKGGKVGTVTIPDVGNESTMDQQGFRISPELRETVMQGLPLFQGPRAGFNPSTFTISLLEGADLSSVIHEGGHFYLEALANMANRPDASQQVKDDFQTTLDWFGISAQNWGTMTLEQKRPFHEQWAQSWERYALEGKSPTLEMQPVFARFRAWMLQVYKNLKEFLKQNPLADKLNDDVRAVFDRLIAAEDAITKSESARGFAPLFKTAQEAGLSEEEFQKYLAIGEEATEQAIRDLGARSLKDMKWLSGAKTKAIKSLQASAAEQRRIIRKEVEQEVLSEPVNRARSLLRDNKVLDDDGELKESTVSAKLDLAEIEATMPNVDLRRLKGMTDAEGGMSLQVAANLFGFNSGEALVNALLNEEKAEDKIQGLTDQRMLERHGDLVDEAAVERAANELVHNEARARFMATGLKILTKSPISATRLDKAAKQAAAGAVASKKIRELTPGQYTMAERQANKKVLEALPSKPQDAVKAQREALLNNRLAKAVIEAKSEVDAMVKYLSKFQNNTTRKNISLNHLEQIDDLLQGINLRKGTSLQQIDKNKSLLDWVEEQIANGFEPALDVSLLEEIKRRHYKDTTVEELRGLTDSVKQIEHIGRLEKRLLTALDRRAFATRIAEADSSIRANANRTVKERGTPTDIIGRAGQFARQFLAAHRKFNSIIREMDGGEDGGVMWNLLARSMNAAGDSEAEMNQQAAKVMSDLFDKIPKEKRIGNFHAKKMNIPGTSIALSQENRIMFALNWGNAGNRQRLLDGGVPGQRALSLPEAEKILDTLTKEEWDFVQGVWDFLETYRDQVGELEQKLTGITPKWVEPLEVVTKFGKYKGGYFPAKYDTELSTRSEALEASTDLRMGMKGVFGASATRNSFTKERSEKVVNRPIALTYDSISGHVSEVVHRLAWQPWLTDANRVLRALDEPIREHYGVEILREMRKTVEDIAAGNIGARTPTEQAINRLRTGATIAAMGWRLSTAMMQPTGIAQSWARIGGKWAAVGVAKFVANPIGSARFVQEQSSFMANRTRTFQREINEVLNEVRSGKAVTNIQASYFFLMGKMQVGIDLPTWLGAYEKALADTKYEFAVNETERKSLEQEAVARADQAVLDSQSGGQIKDLARVQRGSPLEKVFTMFYSYFSATYNLNVEAVRRTDFKSPTQVASFAADFIMINIIPVLLAVALREMMMGKCEIDDVECLAGKYAEEQVSHLFGQMVLLREISTVGVEVVGGQTYPYQGPAGARFFADIIKMGKQYGQGEADWPAVKSTINTLGTVLHWPTGQVITTTEGIMAVENGEVEGVSILPALLFGPPKD